MSGLWVLLSPLRRYGMAQVIGYLWEPRHTQTEIIHFRVLAFAIVFSSKCSPGFSQSPRLLCLHPHEIAKQSSLLCILPSYLVWSVALSFPYSNAPKWKIQDVHERIWICLLKIRLWNDRMPQTSFSPWHSMAINQWCSCCLCRPTSELASRNMSLVIPSPKNDNLRKQNPRGMICLRSFNVGVLPGV